ncbi:hypothetical protein BH11BAC3_BH11BAC3_12800 [soil metagenome]
MYSKQMVSQLNQEFWTTLGQYLSPVLSADGEKINWINYKTGEKHIRFIMLADDNIATIAIELSHKDLDVQQWYFEKFVQLKKILEIETGIEWNWQPMQQDEYGKTISKILISQEGLTILNKSDWAKLISFFKTNMIALDAFWCQHKFAFER